LDHHLLTGIAAATISPAQTSVAHRGFDVGQGNVEDRLLLLIGHRRLQGRDLVVQGLEWQNDVFDGSEASDDILEGHLFVSYTAGICLAHGGSTTLAN
jgi:hypothetical protein